MRDKANTESRDARLGESGEGEECKARSGPEARHALLSTERYSYRKTLPIDRAVHMKALICRGEGLLFNVTKPPV